MIYVSSSCIKRNTILEVVLQFAENDIKNIELSGGTKYYNGLVQDLVRLKKTYNLEYTCHGYFPPPKIPFVVNLASCNDQIYQRSVDYYVNCIEMLKTINCTTLSLHAGFLVEVGVDEIGKKLVGRVVYDEEEAYDRFCTAYNYIAGLCKKSGITLYLENNVISAENYREFGNHNYMMMTDYASVKKMKKYLDFNFLLDIGHLHVSSNSLDLNFSQECALLREYVKWVHISENDGISDEHRILKEDSEIMKEFCKINKSCINVTLETVGTMDEILLSMQMIKEAAL